jgi:protease I
MASVVMIIAPEDFRDEELFETQRELQAADHVVTIASARPGPCRGVRGGSALAELGLDAVTPERFDAVVFVGGPGARQLYDDPRAHAIAQGFRGDGRVVGAICVAPVILGRAGVLRGRRATVFSSESELIGADGASYTGDPVTVDGTLVTASGPAQARAFGRAVAEAIAGWRLAVPDAISRPR